MTDDVLEMRLRDHFAGWAPEGASPSLRDRLAGIPTEAAPAPRRPWPRLAAAAVATVAALAVGVVIARMALVDHRLGPIIVGTPPAPAATPLVLMPGDGVTAPSVSAWFWLALFLMVAIAVVVVRALHRRRFPRWVEWLIVAVTTVVLLSAFGRSTSGSSLVDDGSWAPGPGWVPLTTDTQGSGELERGGAFVVGPNGSFSFALTLRNDGSLPVTIHGLSAIPGPGAAPLSETLAPVLVALGSPEPGQTWSGALVPGPEGVAPFAPVTLAPGQVASLSVLGDAGPCAAPVGTPLSGMAYGLASIRLVLDVVGYGYAEDVPIGEVAIAAVDSCTSP